MANHRVVGKLVIEIKADGNGDWYSIIQPVILSTNGVEYAKLALFAAELKKHADDQVVILNVDEGGKIRKLANVVFRMNAAGNLESVPRPTKKTPDTEIYQQELPFEEVSNDEHVCTEKPA